MSASGPANDDKAFAQESTVEAFVPAVPGLSFRELLHEWDGVSPKESTSIVPFVEQRQFLLLDEQVPVYIALRTSPTEEQGLKSYLARLSITVEARAVGTVAGRHGESQTTQSTQINEVLRAVTVGPDDQPFDCVVVSEAKDGIESVKCLYVFWKTEIFIGRPKSKIQKLGLYFSVSASLKVVETNPGSPADDDYLPSLMPLPLNLMQPFVDDPVLAAFKPYLSAARLTQSAASIASSVRQNLHTLRTGARRLFRAAPALLWRLRFTSLPESPDRDSTLAALDYEVTNFAGSDVLVREIHLDISSGRAEAMGSILPRRYRPGDQATMLFRLTPEQHAIRPVPTNGQDNDLTVNISATVLITKSCQPNVVIQWKTTLDPTLSRPQSRSGVAYHLGKNAVGGTTGLNADPTSPGPDSLTMADTVGDAESSATVAAGVCLTVSGPKVVNVGKVFEWSVFAVNRSDKMQRLAIVPVPKRTRADPRRPNTAGSTTEKAEKAEIAGAIIDDETLHHLQRKSISDPTELICLNPDIRIGPLAASTCYSTTIKFLPLSPGVLHLDSLRLVDLTTQDATDIRDLPDIIAVEKQEQVGEARTERIPTRD